MTGFKRGAPGAVDVKTDAAAKAGPDGARVVKLEGSAVPSVDAFSLPKLRRPGEGGYQAVKSRFGALAATDAERPGRARKDSRFAINPLLRDALSIEEEERRVVEEKVQVRVKAVADDAKARAREEGYQDGLRKGHEEAFRKFQEEGAARIARFDAFLAACESAKAEIFKANERFVVELVFKIARMILLRELKADREHVLRLATEILERVGVRENIRIRVHPDDIGTAASLKEGLEKALGALKNVNVEASPVVSGGGCTVETEWNAIDASVDTQLHGIYAGLVGEGPG